MSAPTAQFYDDTNTDDTKGYTINQNLVTSYTITGTGATANAGITASVTCTGGNSVKVNGTAVTCGSGNSILATTDAAGTVNFLVTGTSLPTQLTLSTGATTKTKWVIVDKAAPLPFPTRN